MAKVPFYLRPLTDTTLISGLTSYPLGLQDGEGNVPAQTPEMRLDEVADDNFFGLTLNQEMNTFHARSRSLRVRTRPAADKVLLPQFAK